MLNAREFTRSPGGPGGRLRHLAPWWCRPGARDVEREALAKAGDIRRNGARWCASSQEGEITWGETTFERLVKAEPEPLTSELPGQPRNLLNVINRPATRSRTSATCWRQPRGPAGPAAAHRRAHRHLTGAARRRRGGAAAEPDLDGRAPRSPSTCSWTSRSTNRYPRWRWHRRTARPGIPDYALDRAVRGGSHPGRSQQVLQAQRSVAKRAALAGDEGGRAGVRGAHRRAGGDHLPQAAVELLDAAYETYRRGHPWVGRLRALPKSRRAGPLRAGDDVRRVHRPLRAGPPPEGLLLRYLTDAYKALRQTVPRRPAPSSWPTLIGCSASCRESDSSRWTMGEAGQTRTPRGHPGAPAHGHRRPQGAAVLVRNAMSGGCTGRRQQGTRSGELDPSGLWGRRPWHLSLERYSRVRGSAPSARPWPDLFRVTEGPGRWRCTSAGRPEGYHEWSITAESTWTPAPGRNRGASGDRRGALLARSDRAPAAAVRRAHAPPHRRRRTTAADSTSHA